jgi:hypothetical protein
MNNNNNNEDNNARLNALMGSMDVKATAIEAGECSGALFGDDVETERYHVVFQSTRVVIN